MPESIVQAFNEFYSKIQLTENQVDDANTKFEGVIKAIHKDYYDFEYNGKTGLLVGSYGKKTHIRPPTDIDAIFLLPNTEYDRFKSLQNPQSQLLQEIRSILLKTYPETDVKAWGKVVLVDFCGHKVEVIPAWKLQNGFYLIPNSETCQWEKRNYDGENNKIKSINNKRNGKAISLIKMIKTWKNNISCSSAPSSYEIENHVINFISVYNPAWKSYSLIIRDFFRYMKYIANEELKSCIETALNRAIKACDFQKTGNLEMASDEWKKIFGDDFPKVYINTSANIEALESYPSQDEEFLFEKHIPINIDTTYELIIDCFVKQDGCRKKSIEKLPFLSHDKELFFSISNCNIPEPYSVLWKVRNFGEEAKSIAQLRGTIVDSNNATSVRYEKTKYNGEHYVECYIIKNNVCVASDIINVPIKKQSIWG